MNTTNGLALNNSVNIDEMQNKFLIMMDSIRKDSDSFPDPFLTDFLTEDDFASIAKELALSSLDNNENQEEYWSFLEKCLVSRRIPYLEDLSDEEYQKYISGNLSRNDYLAIQERCYSN